MFKLYSPSEDKVKGMWGAEDNALIYIMDEVSELVTLSKERATAKGINCSIAASNICTCSEH